MKYSYTCPLCKESVTVDADSDEKALDLIFVQGKAHAKEAHSSFPVPDDMLRLMIKDGMKKEE